MNAVMMARAWRLWILDGWDRNNIVVVCIRESMDTVAFFGLNVPRHEIYVYDFVMSYQFAGVPSIDVKPTTFCSRSFKSLHFSLLHLAFLDEAMDTLSPNSLHLLRNL